MVSFWWEGWVHDLVRLPSAAALDACDVSQAVTIAPYAVRGQVHLPCEPGQDLYLTCSVPGHCGLGQRLHVAVSSTVYAMDLVTGAPLLHSDSLARIYTLLGAKSGDYGTELTRGYQTEEVAESSLELVWCLEDHCATFNPALDLDPQATRESCLAQVNTLAAFLHRKRPEPRYHESERYYKAAIDLVGGTWRACTPISYLVELYVQWGNATAAHEALQHLTDTCGQSAPVTLQAIKAVEQANFEFPPPPSPLPPPQPPSPPPSPAAAAAAYGAYIGIGAGVILLILLALLAYRYRGKCLGAPSPDPGARTADEVVPGKERV